MEVTYIDHMGSDLSVVNAARVSFDKESDWDYGGCACGAVAEVECVCGAWAGDYDTLKEKDQRLINYLSRHGHFTPFTHTSVTLRVKAPIFVARQLFKHKVGLTENEISRRYVDSEPEFYTPKVWRGKPKNKKQGSDGEIPDEDIPAESDMCVEWCKEIYLDLVTRVGVAPEQARMILPQSMYTEWYWTGSVAAFARVYNLRYAKDAQQETGEVARQIGEVIHPLFPVSWGALTSGN